ncbi:fumarylacetoacetate hydrolase family protein [Paeniglutamicibacter cryotolerans]|uniref:Acylpyruvate hydrolase n=1 Tax=Paeniglutamicibacter cryotolerans TaxID=670079 RepID=A0A839QW55_9MICC|nr:fumarylacetoacetate hydrolase family protein [Paeniglutamicibacter cryotolerans]MBB2996241.1 acylpyruvate hydrolase [Paeniglutamicibacter cryotolerans]
MKLATIRHGATTTAAVAVNGGYLPLPARNLSELLGTPEWKHLVRVATSSHSSPDVIPRTEATLLNPVPAPAKVICCGLNYADHILEMGRDLPEYPTLFAKFADTLTDPDAEITSEHSQSLDWEAELAVIVGTTLRDADEAEAAAAIAGYTVANDVSMRDWQSRTLQWFQGKAFDATTPLGPVMVTPDELDPEAGVQVICTLNGEEVQRGNTMTLVFSCARLLSYISTFTTLRPGDVVLTGTPGGVGMGMVPQRFLRDGDLLRTEIPGIGTLTNTVRIRTRATIQSV